MAPQMNENIQSFPAAGRLRSVPLRTPWNSTTCTGHTPNQAGHRRLPFPITYSHSGCHICGNISTYVQVNRLVFNLRQSKSALVNLFSSSSIKKPKTNKTFARSGSLNLFLSRIK